MIAYIKSHFEGIEFAELANLAELNRRGVRTFAEAYNYSPIQRRLAFVLNNNGNVIKFSGPMTGS